jgi:hypothetical protein
MGGIGGDVEVLHLLQRRHGVVAAPNADDRRLGHAVDAPMPAKLASSLTIFKDAEVEGFGLKEVAAQVEERLGEVVARE